MVRKHPHMFLGTQLVVVNKIDRRSGLCQSGSSGLTPLSGQKMRPQGRNLVCRMAAVVSGRARGELEVMEIPAKEFRCALSDLPAIAEKIINSFVARRQWLESMDDISIEELQVAREVLEREIARRAGYNGKH
jgi:hypothetical protein